MSSATSEPPPRPDGDFAASPPRFQTGKGVWVHEVRSPYLHGPCPVEVLLPNEEPSRPRRAVYVLPVHPGVGGRWGDPLEEVRKLDAHNRHDIICVTPAFDAWPYYGAHASDPGIRHEEHLLRVVLPLIESRYDVTPGPEGRLLLGFSKSGWGALSLLFRNPDVFGFAASWDAPLMMSEKNFGLYETAEHFGSREAMARYVPASWAARNPAPFRERTRLAVLGHNFFGTRWFHDLPHTWRFHRLLKRLRIRHVYDNNIKVPHTWNAGWMRPAIDILLRIAAREVDAE